VAHAQAHLSCGVARPAKTDSGIVREPCDHPWRLRCATGAKHNRPCDAARHAAGDVAIVEPERVPAEYRAAPADERDEPGLVRMRKVAEGLEAISPQSR